MKATIGNSGKMFIEPGNETENWSLNQWMRVTDLSESAENIMVVLTSRAICDIQIRSQTK